MAEIPPPHTLRDVARFSPSAAIYFMDGYSDATIRLTSGEEISLKFFDANTSIAASTPFVFNSHATRDGVYTPVPEPLKPRAFLPPQLPDAFRSETTMHLLQVISMNMRSSDGRASLLIGLPYAERFPELFFRNDLFDDVVEGASSYGAVTSLTTFDEPKDPVVANGYPAVSSFAIFHVFDTPMGAFFNKKPTVMELQPDPDGKMALALPPIPFKYQLFNGPIPLFDVGRPEGKSIGAVIAAHHESSRASTAPSEDAWPLHLPDLNQIRLRRNVP
jgi:hypothetical protein